MVDGAGLGFSVEVNQTLQQKIASMPRMKSILLSSNMFSRVESDEGPHGVGYRN